MPDLSSEAKKELMALQAQLKTYLKSFTKLDKNSAVYKKHLEDGKKIQALYVQLSLLDLTVKDVATDTPVTTDSQPKSKKEKRKARRQKRREERKEARADRRNKREDMRLERRKQRNDKSGVKEEAVFRFDELKKLYDILNIEKVNSNFRDYLDEAEALLQKAQNYLSYVKVYTPNQFLDEIAKVEGFIEKLQKFLSIARNISKQIDTYGKLAQQVVAATLDLKSDVEQLKNDAVNNATKIFAKAKAFIATADTDDEELKSKVEKLQGYIKTGQDKLKQLESFVVNAIKDENGNLLPDWYDKIAQQYKELLGGKTDLIPGTKIDDKILLKIAGLKTSIESVLTKFKEKVEDAKIVKNLQNLRQWLKVLNDFIGGVTGFVEDVKDGDLVEIYKGLKTFKNLIESDKDILEGTKIDDTIKAQLKEYSSKAQTWLMNKLTGGDPDKQKEVKEILGLIDKLILSSGDIPDHSKMFADDDDVIKIPEIKNVSQTQIDEVLQKHGISKAGASYEGILSDMKDESEAVKAKVELKYKDAAKRGAEASMAFKKAKVDFDSAIEKHQQYFRASNQIGKIILDGLLAVVGTAVNAVLPGGGAVVDSLGKALTGDFKDLNDHIDKVIPANLGFLSDLSKEILPSLLPVVGSTKGDIELEGDGLMQGLNNLYVNGINARYEEVMALMAEVKGKASVIGKNLRKVENAAEVDADALKEVHKKVIILEIKWSGLLSEVMAKYVNVKYPPIKRNTAIHLASRYMCSSWLIKFPKKEIRIGNSMIKLFDNYGIMTEAKAEWETGFWATAGRSFFGFFGADPFDYRKELTKLKKWASSEHDKLKTAQVWAKVF